MRLYYKKHIEAGEKKPEAREGLEVRRITPPLFSSLRNFLWGSYTRLTGGFHYEYQLWRGDKMVSKDELVTRIPNFRFIPKDGLHLGPGLTPKEERGKGYQRYLQAHVLASHPGRDIYTGVNDDNVASIRCVEKNGCKLFVKGRKTKLGFYIITEMIEHQTGTKKINIER